ncbi:MAG: hypothetical protein DWQ40_00270 [Actinobacteria bacterium]|nr:MAG: hypothetical protein DWQ40_00270 [Actinomycetota bacterium]REK35595.1 MAG: hypothetical protein DWQ20_06115 [Actinomycetota bacterium]
MTTATELLADYTATPAWIHTQGLAQGLKALLASKQPYGHRAAVAVYADRVDLVAIDTPYDYRNWRTIRSAGFQTLDEMQLVVAEWVNEPNRGMWE